jgi:hypothetical protein
MRTEHAIYTTANGEILYAEYTVWEARGARYVFLGFWPILLWERQSSYMQSGGK